MSAMTLTAGRSGGRSAWRSSIRRVTAISRAGTLLLLRNPRALFVTAAMPVALVVLFRLSVPPELANGTGMGAFVVTSLTGATLILVIYYNLVTALVARREELVLKRLRTGESRDAEILAGLVAPGLAIAWGQILIGGLAAVFVFGLQPPTNPLLVVVALVGGTVVFTLLALASTGFTRNVQTAELTTTPVLVASLALSGLMLPVSLLPGPLQTIGQLMPLTPVVDLMRLGLVGTAPDGTTVDLARSFGAAAVPLIILCAWVAAGLLLARRLFRWEPRR